MKARPDEGMSMATVTETTGGDVTEGGRKTPWLLIGGGLGAAALIGGGAAAAVMLAGGGDQPDSVLPATAAAYAQIDLDPEAAQKVTAVRFFQGLDPELRESIDRDWRKWAWEQLEKEGEMPTDVSYEEDIEPWLGDRAGVAVIPAGEDAEPLVAVALQVKDGDAALAFLDEMTAEGSQDVAYYLESDYVVLTQADTLDAVKAAAEQGTLDDNETYVSDMGDLGDTGIVAGWVDAAQASDIDPSALNPGMAMTEAELGLGEQPEVTGRVAGTLRFTADAIEMHGISRGVEGVTAAEDASATRLVGELPADTAGALSVENGSGMVRAAWDYYAELYPDEVAQLSEEAAGAGFTLPDDLMTVLGDSMTLAVGPDIVDAAMNTSPTDPAVPAVPVAYRVTTDTERLQAMLNDNGLGQGVLVMRDDNGTLTLGADQGYVDAVAQGTGDTLGSSDLFTRAVADSDSADFTLFVNVNPFEQYYLPEVTDAEAREALEKLGAVGMSATNENDNDGRFTFRFVADPE